MFTCEASISFWITARYFRLWYKVNARLQPTWWITESILQLSWLIRCFNFWTIHCFPAGLGCLGNDAWRKIQLHSVQVLFASWTSEGNLHVHMFCPLPPYIHFGFIHLETRKQVPSWKSTQAWNKLQPILKSTIESGAKWDPEPPGYELISSTQKLSATKRFNHKRD